MTAAERKAVLRRQAALLPRADAGALLAQFAQLPQVLAARTVMVFCGVGREPDTMPLIRTLLERGQQVALPVCMPRRKMEARIISDESQLTPGRFGIPEPEDGCPAISPDEIDAVLVPCLMCDREGYRLGHGGGYYDRWLTGYDGFTALVCPCDRVVDRLPREEFDRPVHLVLTDTV